MRLARLRQIGFHPSQLNVDTFVIHLFYEWWYSVKRPSGIKDKDLKAMYKI
jgi:hypothetical protein